MEVVVVEFKNLKFQIKMNPNDEGRFSGYAAFKGNVDSHNDIILDGAFKRTLRNRKQFPILYGHDPMKPVGISTVMKEDKSGLYTEGQIDLSTDLGKMVYSGLKMGYLSSMSIGYQVIKDDIDKKGHRLLKEIKLLEYSILPTGFGANELATISSVKHRSIRDESEEPLDLSQKIQQLEEKQDDLEDMIVELKQENEELRQRLADPLESTQPVITQDSDDSTLEIKTVSGSTSLPIAGRDIEWSGSKARNQLFENMATAKNGFFWYEDPEEKGGYKLPFAYKIDGKMQAIPKGIFAVAGVLQGGMGGVDIPESAQNAIKKKVDVYYRRMREQFDDPSIVPPWDKKENNTQEKPKSLDAEAFLNVMKNFVEEVKQSESRET
jgi:HK97 family phage prohead protease